MNPNKSEIGKISKVLLDNINCRIRTDTGLNQWKNTGQVIDWFSKIERKDKCKFIIFDIESFYPNITSELLCKALDWASQYVDIRDDDRNIILTAKNTLLYRKKYAMV